MELSYECWPYSKFGVVRILSILSMRQGLSLKLVWARCWLMVVVRVAWLFWSCFAPRQ